MLRVQWFGQPLPVLLFILGLSSFWISEIFAECWYSGKNHQENVEVPTAEPCLNCTCSKGALLCYLRVCPKLPNPPPKGCILLHRYHTCCPELICTGDNALEARSEPDEIQLPPNDISAEYACVVNGSIYGSGSAMASSSLCEYCYCLRGKQVCVKPTCLLPIPGCAPIYQKNNCCPIRYNCTGSQPSTTTQPAIALNDGCYVDGSFYPEGGRVLGVGHSTCDNCYCLHGLLRCEPLSCAPPLLGCAPVIKPDDCCAASYNCSTIQIKPEPTYGNLIVSQDYAKLRKSQVSTEKIGLVGTQIQRSSGTTRHFKASTTKPFLEKIELKNYALNTFDNEGKTAHENKEVNDALLGILDSLLDSRLNRRVEGDGTTTEAMTTETEGTTFESTTETSTTTDFPTTTDPGVITVQTVLNSTDCIEETTIMPLLPKSEDLPEFTTAESQVHSSGPTIRTPIQIDSILNITKLGDDDYEYDYNEPSLPPSLPNLRIIPFVAADALDSELKPPQKVLPPTASAFQNFFSPPVETQGGFIPKQPSNLDNFYENAVTNSPGREEASCVRDGHKILHGEGVPAKSPCTVCSCFYGNIVCQQITCPLPNAACRKIASVDSSFCCPQYSCETATKVPESFYDVIKTEPAPNLQFLVGKTTSPPSFPSSSTAKTDGLGLDKVLEFLFSGDGSSSPSSSSTTEVISTNSVGVLKLAGCNIYGRMYRVGRIISELSTPCLECKCTDVGVQCQPLAC